MALSEIQSQTELQNCQRRKYDLRPRNKIINYNFDAHNVKPIIKIEPDWDYDDVSLDLRIKKRPKLSPKVKDGGEFVADENISESEDDDDDDEGEESNDFFCLFCEYGPVTWCALKKHEKLNHPLKCMVCIKDCETKEHLRIHKLVKHGKECQLCRRTFIGLNGLKNHQRRSFLHWCIVKARRTVYNEMVEAFKLPVEKLPPPLYVGFKKDLVKHPLIKNRQLHESVVIKHIKKLAEEQIQSAAAEPSTMVAEECREENNIQQTDNAQQFVEPVPPTVGHQQKSVKFVLSDDAAKKYCEANSQVMPDLCLVLVQGNADEVGSSSTFVPDYTTAAGGYEDSFVTPIEHDDMDALEELLQSELMDWNLYHPDITSIFNANEQSVPIFCAEPVKNSSSGGTVYDLDSGQIIREEHVNDENVFGDMIGDEFMENFDVTDIESRDTWSEVNFNNFATI